MPTSSPSRPAPSPSSRGPTLQQRAATPADESVALASANRSVPTWARRLAQLLDEAIRIPGTNFRIGIDGILGLFFPAAGDALTAVGSASLLVAALRQGVPTVILARMVLNIAVDALLGCIPLVGDAFDFVFKASSRNLALMEQYSGRPERRPTARDYVVVGAGLSLVVLSVVLPILVLGALLASFTDWVSR